VSLSVATASDSAAVNFVVKKLNSGGSEAINCHFFCLNRFQRAS
jgi:hypothetical protein